MSKRTIPTRTEGRSVTVERVRQGEYHVVDWAQPGANAIGWHLGDGAINQDTQSDAWSCFEISERWSFSAVTVSEDKIEAPSWQAVEEALRHADISVYDPDDI